MCFYLKEIHCYISELSWETEESSNKLGWIIEKGASGADGHLSYDSKLIGKPKSEIRYLIKGNVRRFRDEMSLSLTLEQSSIIRVCKFSKF